MIEIPWLRSDVAANIRNNFAFYFGYERFGLYAACVAAVIVLNCMAVKFFFAGEYRFSAGDRRFFFNRKDKSELAGAAALAFSFLLYALNLFSLELSVFGNYDQMVVNNILDMRRGLQPVFTSMRFNPAAGIDHNIIYGITHHYALIGGWVLLKQALCLWLLYRFFVFVSAARRLFMLAAVNFLPAVFWVNGIVYSEQNTLIFVLLSLTALQKYDGRHGLRQLLWFALWANLAIYTKETNIFVYFGILLYLVLAKVWAGKITLRSFLSPFKTVAGMPAEYILFWSMLLFSAGYLLLSNLLTDGAYVRHHHQELPTLLAINAAELCLAAAALAVFVRNVLRRGGRGAERLPDYRLLCRFSFADRLFPRPLQNLVHVSAFGVLYGLSVCQRKGPAAAGGVFCAADALVGVAERQNPEPGRRNGPPGTGRICGVRRRSAGSFFRFWKRQRRPVETGVF